MLPKISAPLAKSIRTGEGILIYGSAALVVVLGAVKDVGWGKSALFLTILSGVQSVSRAALKVGALNNGFGFGPPIAPGKAFPAAQPVLYEIDKVTAALEALQSQPGTPADSVTQGLSPTPVSATGGVQA